MTVEKAIFELVKSAAPGLNGKVYALRAPQNAAPPFAVFQRTDSQRWRAINNPSGIVQAFIQVDVYAREYYEAKELADLVETTLDGYRGDAPFGEDSPRDTVKIGGISLQNDLDIIDQTDTPLLFRNSASYLVTYHKGI